MGNSGTVDTPVDDGERSGIDRRTLIKRAAAAGAVAWTAPIIIGSLTSPAGAITVAPNTYMFQVTPGGGTCAVAALNADSCTAGTALPGWNAAGPALPSVCQPVLPNTATCTQALDTISFTIPGGCSCVFTQGRGQYSAGGTTCITGSGAGTTSMGFTKPSGAWQVIRMVVTCG